jgi:hypothetical protein
MTKRLEDMTEPELRELMTAFVEQLKVVAAVMGVEGPQFCLVVFNDPKVAQYAANCDRSDMILAMREAADRLEKHQDVTR